MPKNPNETVYFEHPLGGAGSCTRAHWETYHCEGGEDGSLYPTRGFKEITEAAARKANPRLFGAPDPTVQLNLNEIKLERERMALSKEIQAAASEVADED